MTNIKIIFKRVLKRPYSILVMIAMCAISFYMFSGELTENVQSLYYVHRIHNMFGIDEEQVGFVQLLKSSNSLETAIEVKNKMNDIQGIKGAGFRSGYTIFSQKSNSEIPIFLFDTSIIESVNVDVDEKTLEEMRQETEYEPILLGPDFKGKYELGEVIEYEYASYKVYGFLKEDSAIYHDFDLFGGWTNLDLYNLDSAGVVVMDDLTQRESVNSSYIQFITEKNEFDNVAKELIKYSLDNGIELRVVNRAEEIKNELKEKNILNSDDFYLLVLVGVVTIITITTMSVTYIMLDRRDYGILMINGLKSKSIHLQIILQNLLIVMLGAIIGWMINQKLYYGTLIISQTDININFLYLIYYKTAMIFIPIIMCLTSVVIVALSSIIPVYITSKLRLADLVQTENE